MSFGSIPSPANPAVLTESVSPRSSAAGRSIAKGRAEASAAAVLEGQLGSDRAAAGGASAARSSQEIEEDLVRDLRFGARISAITNRIDLQMERLFHSVSLNPAQQNRFLRLRTEFLQQATAVSDGLTTSPESSLAVLANRFLSTFNSLLLSLGPLLNGLSEGPGENRENPAAVQRNDGPGGIESLSGSGSARAGNLFQPIALELQELLVEFEDSDPGVSDGDGESLDRTHPREAGSRLVDEFA